MKPAGTVLHLIHRLRHGGIAWLGAALRERITPARPSFVFFAQAALSKRRGLEIGGPSRLFRLRGGLPVYAWAASIDNINFAAGTAWEAGLREGGDFIFNTAKPAGRQYLREATDLHGLADASYDFLLSSHCLEHVANPLAALREWHRVTRPGGHLLLALPDPVRTFDHRRPVTTFAHLESDFARQTGEDDLTHLQEILALHDLARDPLAGSHSQFEIRARANAENRCLHHHVFDLALMRAALTEAGWTVHATETLAPLHLAAWAQKPAV